MHARTAVCSPVWPPTHARTHAHTHAHAHAHNTQHNAQHQGALEEAQLISWPTPGKALLDTVLVLAIVAVTGSLLFGLNVLLADASNLWYSK
jgi:preprotein translocase subunit SecE